MVHAHASPHGVSGDDARRASDDSNGRHVEAAGGDAWVALQAFVAVAPVQQTPPATIAAAFLFPTPPVQAAKDSVYVTGGHDPPPRSLQSARAPPHLS